MCHTHLVCWKDCGGISSNGICKSVRKKEELMRVCHGLINLCVYHKFTIRLHSYRCKRSEFNVRQFFTQKISEVTQWSLYFSLCLLCTTRKTCSFSLDYFYFKWKSKQTKNIKKTSTKMNCQLSTSNIVHLEISYRITEQ